MKQREKKDCVNNNIHDMDQSEYFTLGKKVLPSWSKTKNIESG